MKILRSFWVLALAAVLGGCDYVDAPYIVEGPDGCTVTEPDFVPRTNPVRKVLVEDFTGHRCGNCPRAAEAIHDMQEAHPGQVVALGVHSVYPSEYTSTYPNDIAINPQLKYIYNFTREVSNAIDEKFQVSNSGLPKGMVNRMQVSGSRALSYSTWETHASSILAGDPDVDIQVKPFYDAADSSLCTYVYTQFLNPIGGRYKVVAYLTENGFVSWQKDYDASPQDIQLYEHNHILRENISSVWGTLLVDGTATAGEEYINGYSITIDPSKYDITKCYVVAFVYDETTWEVIQAEEQKIIN